MTSSYVSLVVRTHIKRLWAFFFANGTFTTVDVPGQRSTDALVVNAAGDVVGRYGDASGTVHGFLREKGTMTTIDPPGSTFAEAIGINSRGPGRRRLSRGERRIPRVPGHAVGHVMWG